MKKSILICCLALFIGTLVSAQKTEFKIAKKTGVLQLSLSNVLVQGYDGNEIVFSSPTKENQKPDPRAKGLRLLSESGLKDNTGLDLNVQQEGNIVQVHYVSKNQTDSIVVKVPNTMSVKLSSNALFGAGTLKVQNFGGELEVSSNYSPVQLLDVTGPVTAKTLYSELTVKLNQVVKGPISLVSVYGFVDVTLPQNLKANLSLSTQYGNIYAADDLDIQSQAKTPPTTTTGFPKPTQLSGLLNGGGINLSIQSTYGKIYLRKL